MKVPGWDFYKTAFVVTDLRSAAERLSRIADFDWLEVPGTPHDFRIGSEVRNLRVRALITRQRPRLHLLEEIPGTPWTANASGAAHHVAYWVDNIGEEARKLTAAGFTIECCDAADPSGPQHWAYFVAPDGVRLELLDRQGAVDPEAAIDGLPLFDSGHR